MLYLYIIKYSTGTFKLASFHLLACIYNKQSSRRWNKNRIHKWMKMERKIIIIYETKQSAFAAAAAEADAIAH